MLDRTKFQARLAENAVRPAIQEFTLPKEGIVVRLRTPNKEMVQRAWAAAGGDEDADLIGTINLLKFVLVGEDDEPLPRSFTEARGWFNTLENEDAAALMEDLTEIIQALAPEEAETDEDPVASGKAS